jgi:hypothetical protein
MPPPINDSISVPSAASEHRGFGDWTIMGIALIAIVLFIVITATFAPIDPGPFQPTDLVVRERCAPGFPARLPPPEALSNLRRRLIPVENRTVERC